MTTQSEGITSPLYRLSQECEGLGFNQPLIGLKEDHDPYSCPMCTWSPDFSRDTPDSYVFLARDLNDPKVKML